MKRPVMLAVAGGVLVLGLWGGWRVYQTRYVKPREEIRRQVESYERGLEEREAEMMQLAGLRARLQRIGATTLGADEETVNATLRTAVNEILASVRLSDGVVSTGRAEGVRNPAATRAGDFTGRPSRTRPDFFAMTANARGIGSFEAALRGIATLQAQPWVHRIEGWAITPVDRTRERFELTVELSTVFFTDAGLRPASAAKPGERVWTPLPEGRFAAYRPILARAAFKEPPAPPPRQARPAEAVVQAPPPRTAPPPPPYADWRVTAVSNGVQGPELGLHNRKSGEWTVLTPGQGVLDATFVEAQGEEATVEIGGVRYLVRLGESLADRQAVSR